MLFFNHAIVSDLFRMTRKFASSLNGTHSGRFSFSFPRDIKYNNSVCFVFLILLKIRKTMKKLLIVIMQFLLFYSFPVIRWIDKQTQRDELYGSDK